MKKIRLKKFAVQFYNELLNEQRSIEVEAYQRKEAIDIATLQIDAKYNDWSDEYGEFFKIQKVEAVN